jgi:para-nitrobenzyl esterase
MRIRSLPALALLASVSLALGCSFGAPRAPEAERTADPAARRTTSAGEVVGFVGARGNHAWLGLPFAKPPVGELRWRAPVPPEPWGDVREALQAGPACPQFANPLASDAGAERDGVVGDEDCLYLNVFTPRSPDGPPKGLPVLFWIHGGGNSIGHGGSYDGGALAQEQNVVVVTTNYRLGVLGWFRHPALAARGADARDRSGNFGTLDLIRSLEWVRDHIASFGGDPANVTIFGESAGGHNVLTLLVAPGARGLFHRALSQSGGTGLDSIAAAENYTDQEPAGDLFSSREVVLRLMQREGPPERESARQRAESMSPSELATYLRTKSTGELFAIFESGGGFGMYRSPKVFGDGHVLPEGEIQDLLAAGRDHRVPVMLGTNRDEVKLFMSADPGLVQRVLWIFPRVRDPRIYDLSAEYQSALWKAGAVDGLAEALVASGNPDVFAYRFDWDEEGRRLYFIDLSRLIGAGHGMEIPFVFDSFGKGAFARVFDASSAPGRETLGAAMRAYWAEFARTGDPGRGDGSLPLWSRWSAAPGADKFVLLDTEADGGIRMSGEAVTRAGLLDAIASDARFRDAEERCALYGNLVRFSDLTPEEYAGRGCAGDPLEDVAAR